MRHIAILVMAAAPVFAASVEVVAGGGTGEPGVPARQIQFIEPFGVAFDHARHWYVVEFKGERIIQIDARGQTSLYAGRGEKIPLKEPHGLVIGRDRQMYIADTHADVIRQIDLRNGKASIIAGNGTKGYSGDGGPAKNASFHGIFAIDLGPGGRYIYVADLSNRRVRAVDLQTGMVNLVAGNGESGVPKDGADAKTSPLVDPRAVTADAQGNVYILERRGNALRVVDKSGKIRTLVAPGQVKPDMNGPKHLCMDRDGGVIIADAENHLIRKYFPKTQKLETIAGTGEKGDRIVADDPLRTQLNRPHGVIVDARGDLWISDSYNHRVLRVRRDR